MLYPHDYSVLFDLALAETDTNYRQGHEGNTVHDLYDGHYQQAVDRRKRAGHSFRSLERLGLVERAGSRRQRIVWQTTADGYDTVFRAGTSA